MKQNKTKRCCRPVYRPHSATIPPTTRQNQSQRVLAGRRWTATSSRASNRDAHNLTTISFMLISCFHKFNFKQFQKNFETKIIQWHKTFAVQVFECIQQLQEIDASVVLGEATCSNYAIKQLSSSCKLKHNEDLSLGSKHLVQLDNVRVIKSLGRWHTSDEKKRTTEK